MSEKNHLQNLKNELQREEKINSRLDELKEKTNTYKFNNKLWNSNINLTSALTTAITNYNSHLSSVYNNIFSDLSITNIQVYKSKIDLLKMTKLHLSAFDTELCNSIKNGLFGIIQQQRNLLVHLSSISGFNNYYYNTIIELAKALAKDPENIENWEKYYDELTEYFWIIPYGMSPEELNEILEEVSSEKEFDERVNKYFNKEKIRELFNKIEEQLKGKKLKMFKQIETAYFNRSYVLASLGIISMIDNELSHYLVNKGMTKRQGILEPIVKDLKNKGNLDKEFYIVMMMNSNINLLFKDYNLNKVKIDTHKVARRHPILHGKIFDVKEIDVIMLFNTLYYLLNIREYLSGYKNKLIKENGSFKIATRRKKKEILKKLKEQNNNLQSSQTRVNINTKGC